jgi:hypothetical protein
MSVRYTPIGFLPGDIEVNTHCIFTYGKKDDAFIRSVVEFLAAGINAREFCVCALDSPARDRVRDRMMQLGVDSDPNGRFSQFAIFGLKDVYYTPAGVFDTYHALKFWHEKLNIANQRWNGLRCFVDAGTVPLDRPSRLKLLEYEAILNINFSANLAMCAYQSDVTSRSFFLQARKLHPYIANVRSLRKKHDYVPSEKFFAGFYRYNRVSRTYGYSPGQLSVVQEDLENLAARTPLRMSEIRDLKDSLAVVFGELLQQNVTNTSNLHIIFDSKPDKFAVILSCRKDSICPQSESLVDRISPHLMSCSLDEFHVKQKGDVFAVSLVKHISSAPWDDFGSRVRNP